MSTARDKRLNPVIHKQGGIWSSELGKPRFCHLLWAGRLSCTGSFLWLGERDLSRAPGAWQGQLSPLLSPPSAKPSSSKEQIQLLALPDQSASSSLPLVPAGFGIGCYKGTKNYCKAKDFLSFHPCSVQLSCERPQLGPQMLERAKKWGRFSSSQSYSEAAGACVCAGGPGDPRLRRSPQTSSFLIWRARLGGQNRGGHTQSPPRPPSPSLIPQAARPGAETLVGALWGVWGEGGGCCCRRAPHIWAWADI